MEKLFLLLNGTQYARPYAVLVLKIKQCAIHKVPGGLPQFT